MLVETLRADWTARGTNARVCALPEFDGGALTLGAGTKIAERRALQLAANRLAGEAWEAAAQEGLAETGAEVFPQVTVETQSGTRYITDFVTRDPATGDIGCVECKASPTASFTPKQRVAIPEIAQGGATVVTPNVPELPRGTGIPPKAVQVLIGPEWPPKP